MDDKTDFTLENDKENSNVANQNHKEDLDVEVQESIMDDDKPKDALIKMNDSQDKLNGDKETMETIHEHNNNGFEEKVNVDQKLTGSSGDCLNMTDKEAKAQLVQQNEQCNICGQFLNNSDIIFYQGHPQDSVEEFVALTNEKLVLASGMIIELCYYFSINFFCYF